MEPQGQEKFIIRSKAKIDILVIFFLAIAVYLVSAHHDLLEMTVAFAQQHEDWNIDELFIVGVLVTMCFGVYSWRRLRETRRFERQLEKQNVALKKSLEEIDALQGLIPICASCKRIRDDHGYWHQVEAYVSSHSRAQFTHSICPDCKRKLYPELCHDLARPSGQPSDPPLPN